MLILPQALAFYFPGRVLCVDDSALFLDMLRLKLSTHFKIETDTNPLEALKAIEKMPEANESRMLEAIDDSNYDEEFECAINVDLTQLVELAKSPQHLFELTVLVVDQSMPEMNGLDLCARLKGTRFKKIMLTGEPQDPLALKAFNEGVIDHFITKSEPATLIPALTMTLLHLKQRYFQERSALILAACKAQPTSFLKSPLFLDQFNLFLRDKEIIEFYLLDTMGSFLGKDAAGKTHHFLVKSEKQMADLLDIAKSAEGDGAVIQSLEEMTAMIYFFRPEERDLEVSAWKKMMRPITKKVDGFYLSID